MGTGRSGDPPAKQQRKIKRHAIFVRALQRWRAGLRPGQNEKFSPELRRA